MWYDQMGGVADSSTSLPHEQLSYLCGNSKLMTLYMNLRSHVGLPQYVI
jgi:hypothetical protein